MIKPCPRYFSSLFKKLNYNENLFAMTNSNNLKLFFGFNAGFINWGRDSPGGRKRFGTVPSKIFNKIILYHMVKLRKYKKSYLLFGYTYIIKSERIRIHQCILCGSISNVSLRPSKLKSHILSYLPKDIDNKVTYF